MSKLSKDINKLVETLDSNNKKSGVEVPSESGNRTEEMLTIICGSLAGLVYGDTGADDEKLRQSLGKKPMLFEELAKLNPQSIVSALETAIDTVTTDLQKLSVNISNDTLAATQSVVNNMSDSTKCVTDTITSSNSTLNSTFIDGYTNLIDSINILDTNLNNVVSDLTSQLIDITSSLSAEINTLMGDINGNMSAGVNGITAIIGCLGPKGAIVAAVIEAVYGLAQKFNLEPVLEQYNKLNETLMSILSSVGQVLSSLSSILMTVNSITPLLTVVSSLLKVICTVVESILKPVELMVNKINDLFDAIINKLLKPIEIIQAKLEETFSKLEKSLDGLLDAFVKLLDSGITEVLDVLLNVITPLLEPISIALNSIVKSIEKITGKVESISESAKASADVIIGIDNATEASGLFNALQGISGEHVENINKLSTALDGLSKVDLSNFKNINDNTKNINETVTNVNKVDKKELDNAMNTLNSINSLVLTAGAILLIGSILMKVIDPKDLIIFSVTLLTFVGGIIAVGLLASKFMDKSIEHIAELGKLVFLCGVTLLLGSYLGRNIEISDYIKFTFALSLFILGTTMPILLFGKNQKEVFANMGNFAKLLITASIVMLLGSLVINLVPLASILKFTLTLSLFIALTCLPFVMFSKLNKDVSKSANNFNALLITSSICMLLGAFIIQYLDIANVLLFTGLLALFITGVSLPLLIFSKLSDKAGESIKGFTGLVIASSIVMLLGALLVDLIGIDKILKFTGMLSLFILGTALPLLVFAFLSKDIHKTFDSFRNLIISCSIVMFLGALLVDVIGLRPILTFTFALSLFILGTALPFLLFAAVDQIITKSAYRFIAVIALTSIVMFLGALITKVISWGDILNYIGMLSLFVLGVSLIFLRFLAISKHISKSALIFAGVVAIISLTLALSAFLMKYISLVDLFLFPFALALFMVLVTTPLIMLLSIAQPALLGAKELALIIAVSAATLLAGSFAMKYINYADLLLFTATLSAFIFAICHAYRIATKDLKQNMTAAKQFGILIAISAGTLLVGGTIFTLWPEIIPGLALFGTILAAFIMAVCYAYQIATKSIKKNFTTAKQFGILVAISAATLLAGGYLFMEFPDLPANVALFGVVLAAFMLAMAGILKILNKMQGDIIKGVVAMGMLTVVTGMITLIMWGIGAICEKYGLLNILAGVGIMALIVVAMGALTIGAGLILSGPQAAIFGLGIVALGLLALTVGPSILLMMAVVGRICDYDTKDWLGKLFEAAKIVVALAAIATGLGLFMIPLGIPFALGCAAITALGIMAIPLAMVMGLIAALSKYDAKSMLKMVGVIAATMVAFAGIATALGMILIIPFVGKAFRKGLAVLPMLATVALLSGIALLSIAKAMQIMKSIGKFDASNIIHSLTQVLNIAPALAPFNWRFANKVWAAESCIKPLTKMISELAKTIEEYANLKVAVYEGTKVVGYRQLTKKDFKSAGDNIALILTTLIAALDKCYEGREDFFNGGWFNDSPAIKVINVGKKLASMIGDMAEAVKDYANMMVPTQWDNEGKPIAYRQLSSKDFKNAADNISYIMTTMIEGLNTCYNNNKEIFSGTGWLGLGDSPASKVIKTLGNLGNNIGDITDSVIKIATGLVPISWNSEGKPTKFKQLKPADYISAANTIAEILVTMIRGLDKAYSQNPEIFTGTGWLGWGDCKAKKVIKSVNGLGELVGGLADGVIKFATGTIATEWDKDGKPIKYRALTAADYNAAAATVASVLLTTVNGVSNAYYSIPGSPSQIKERIECFMELGTLISNISKGVQSMATLQFADQWDKDGKPIHFTKLSNGDIIMAGFNASMVLLTMANAVATAKKNIDTIIPNADIKSVIETMSSITSLIGKVATSIGNFAALKIATKYNHKGDAIAYRQLSSEDIINCHINILLMIDTLIHAAEVANERAKKFVESNTLDSLLDVMNSITDLLSKNASLISIYGSGKAGLFDKDGKLLQTLNIDYGKASANILLGFYTLLNAYDNINTYIKKNKVLYDPTELLNIMGNIIDILQRSTKILSYFGSGLFPFVVDKDGNVTKVARVNFGKAHANIKSTINTLVEAVLSAYDEHKDLFTGQDETITTMFDTIMSVFDKFTPVSEIIGFISKGFMPVRNGDKLMVVKLDLDGLNKNLYGVLSAVPTIINQLYENCPGFTLLSDNEMTKSILKTVDNIVKVTDAVCGAMPSITTIGKELTKMSNNFKRNDVEKSKLLIDAIFTLTLEVALLTELANNKNAKTLAEDESKVQNYLIYISRVSGYLSYYTQLIFNDLNSSKVINSNKVGDVISNLNYAFWLSTLLGQERWITSTAGNKVNWHIGSSKSNIQYNDYHKNLLESSKNLINHICVASNSIANDVKTAEMIDVTKASQIISNFNSLIKILELFGTEVYAETVTKRNWFGFITGAETVNRIKTYSLSTEKINLAANTANLLNIICSSNRKMSSIIDNSKLIDITKFEQLITTYNSVVKVLSNYLDNSSVLNIFNITKINAFKTVLDVYLECVENIKKIQDINEDIDTGKIDGLKETIAKINESVESVSDPYYFGEQQKTLSKYVHSINSINVNKVNSLNKLLTSMNHLAYKMGNLDKFTKVLADDVTQVLNKLAAEMKNAKYTIEEAQRLQNMREQSIKNSIQEIRKLMNEPMTVEIYQSSNGNTNTDIPTYTPDGPAPKLPGGGKGVNPDESSGGYNDPSITVGGDDVGQDLTVKTAPRSNVNKEFNTPNYTQSDVNKMIIMGIEQAFKTGVKINKTGNVVTVNGSKV